LESGQSFEVIIRKAKSTAEEEIYRVTIFRKIDAFDELLLYPDISNIINNRVVRVEKIDNFRFEICIHK
jgi:hypothetical protein